MSHIYIKKIDVITFFWTLGHIMNENDSILLEIIHVIFFWINFDRKLYIFYIL